MFNTVELDSDITILLGDDQQSNSILLCHQDSLIVIDTFGAGRDAVRLCEIVCCQGAPLRYIANTHWHSDHIGGNIGLKGMFPESNIIAHVSHRDTIIAEEDVIIAHEKLEADEYPQPQITIEDNYEIIPDLMMMYVGGHTKDSCIMHIPSKSLVFCGDVVLSAGVMGGVSIPYFYWGNPHELLDALKRIINLNPRLLIPGHGWLVKPDILNSHIIYLQRLLDAYAEYHHNSDFEVSEKALPAALELETLLDCTKGVHWTFRKMHYYNIRCLEKIAKLIRPI